MVRAVWLYPTAGTLTTPPMSVAALKVLFLPGLESGVKGRKANYLRKVQ